MYSLIAGVLPKVADRGVGFAVKQHQRAWALARGITSMVWTFDPLVSRNARFNLTKLGARVSDYEQNFYGLMDDEINADDESDRLVVVWPLDAVRSVDRSEGRVALLTEPEFTSAMVREVGPDGDPVVVDAQGAIWVRVPRDVVKLRAENPAQARAWRLSIRSILKTAFAAGYTATGTTRTGWYRLTTGRDQ
jgi:predicted GNAT superfamily acetyltransferase